VAQLAARFDTTMSPIGRFYRLSLALLTLLLATTASARVISFPMHLEHTFVRQLLLEELFTGPNESTQVWQDESRCNDIVLSQPKLVGRDGKLHIVTNFNAKLGAGVGKWCLNVTDWKGILDTVMEPQLHPSLPIVNFRVVDSDILGSDGTKSLTGTLWDWVKSRVHPRLETIRIDLYQPINELKMFLPMLFPGTDINRMQHLLDSIALADVVISGEDIALRVQLDVPEPAPTTPAQALPEPTLTMDEVERWDKAWQSWDGFLTFLIKHSSRDASEQLRRDLREVFLEARYDIIEILRPTETRTSDPVRPLFLRTWKRLAPIMRQLTTDLPGEAALRYMSLITAADALSALEQLGPEYGVEITTDGLRRMARMIEPAPFGDPVSYSDAIDPELRKLFGFGPPLPTPELTEEDQIEEDTPVPQDASTPAEETSPTPEEKSESRNPHSEPYPLLSGIGSRLSDFISRIAKFPLPAAADEPRQLDRWIPTRDDVLEYLPLVRELLEATAASTRAEKKLEAGYTLLYRNMMLTTAWQESCWRQFIKKGGKLQPLTSPVGAVGIMQVNVRVWRGFYDQQSLRNSMTYNAKAGSEILLHYLVDYAIAKGELKVRNDVDDLARATYAAYNGGPAKLRRYRRQAGHHIDQAFWKKYQQIKAGNDMAVASCFGVTASRAS
jgi:hypothetical protein